jgi:putative oxidoreductase
MIGGLMLVSGLFSRAISLPLAGTMVVAYLTAHRDEAFLSISDFTDQAPYSFLMATLFLFAFGAGRFSVDHFLQPRIAKFFSTSNIKS